MIYVYINIDSATSSIIQLRCQYHLLIYLVWCIDRQGYRGWVICGYGWYWECRENELVTQVCFLVSISSTLCTLYVLSVEIFNMKGLLRHIIYKWFQQIDYFYLKFYIFVLQFLKNLKSRRLFLYQFYKSGYNRNTTTYIYIRS